MVENYGFVNTGYDAVYLATVENDTVSPESYMGHYIEYLEGLRLAAFTTNVVERNFRKNANPPEKKIIFWIKILYFHTIRFIMRAFIMAAGEGTRMWPLTETRPKPLIPVANKPIIEHIFDALVNAGVNKIAVLVGYDGRKIIDRYGHRYLDAEIDYVYQERRMGTGDAALYAEKFDDEKFIFINGDLIFDGSLLKKIIGKENAVVGVFQEDAENYGILEGDTHLVKIKEKEKGIRNAWVNGGIYVLTREIFRYLKNISLSPRGELEFTDAVNLMAKDIPIEIVRWDGQWVDVGRPWDLLKATKEYLKNIKGDVRGTIEQFVTIKNEVVIGDGTLIKSGTYIEGPVIIGKNCVIGPNAYIRPYTVIGDNCHIGNACEVKASIIMNGSKIPHFNYVGDSIIGEGCNLGAGTKIANLRLDEANIKVPVKGHMVDTGRRKLGVIMGDDVHTGINVSIDVGTMIGAHTAIAPGARVKGVINSESRVY